MRSYLSPMRKVYTSRSYDYVLEAGLAKRTRFIFTCIALLWITIVTSRPVIAAEASPPGLWIQDALQGVRPGIRFDPDRQTWDFYGVVDQLARYEIPPAMIDLARVRYRLVDSGDIRTVWVALGLEMPYSRERGYLTRGPWISSNHARRWAHVGSLVRVSVSRNGVYEQPMVSNLGVDWSACLEQLSCKIASTFDQQHLDLSNRFIQSGSAPGWYPWGFLFWYVEVFESEFNRMITGEEDTPTPFMRRQEARRE